MTSAYRRMEKAIRYIEDRVGEQPGLGEIARHVGLSPHHFQRVFRRWTGISPKRYLQFMTIENAKKLLRRSVSLLDTACETGLSGTGRLHDLFVSVEAMTPGQFKSRGAGLRIMYGVSDSPFGRCLLAWTGIGICSLWFPEPEDDSRAIAELEAVWAGADLVEDNAGAAMMVSRIFSGSDADRLKLNLRGTNFQIKVWQALLRIPEGSVASYTDVAGNIGRPDAVRAVAGAVASNPVAWLIPCHRVLRRSGEIGGYRWGPARKKMMLAQEQGEKEP